MNEEARDFTGLNSDEVLEALKQDELADATKLSPREYGKLRGIAPQLVYYHARNHAEELPLEKCQCGRTVIDVKLADQYFSKGEYSPTSSGEDRE